MRHCRNSGHTILVDRRADNKHVERKGRTIRGITADRSDFLHGNEGGSLRRNFELCPDKLGERLAGKRSGFLSESENIFWLRHREQVHGPGDDPRPAGLVARTNAGTIITMKILVKE